jgi:hypothetical protein
VFGGGVLFPKFLSFNDSLSDGSDLILRLDGLGTWFAESFESPLQVRLDWQSMIVMRVNAAQTLS